MKPLLFLLLLVPLVLLAACGDDDDDAGTSDPNSTESESLGDAYVGGLRDIQPVHDPASGGLAGGEVAPADEYRAQAATYRELADGLQHIEPPQESATAHGDFVFATLAVADDLDALADAVDAGDAVAEEAARAQLVSDTIPFLLTCEAVGLTNCEAWAPVD